MRATLTSLVLVLAVGLLPSQANAQGCCCYLPPPQAPDMRGPGYLWTSPYGITYGPNYNVRPPFPPFHGMIFAPPKPPPGCPVGSPGGSLGFPSHLYARSPRDFFMIDTHPAANPYSYRGTSPLSPVRGDYVPVDRGAYAPVQQERPMAPPPGAIPPPPP